MVPADAATDNFPIRAGRAQGDAPVEPQDQEAGSIGPTEGTICIEAWVFRLGPGHRLTSLDDHNGVTQVMAGFQKRHAQATGAAEHAVLADKTPVIRESF